jgi:phosphatidylinositol alpha-mannosyltransferase
LRIGIVTQSYYPKPGGVTEVVHYSARELRRLGHHVTIITTNYSGGAEEYPGVRRIGRNMLVPVNGAWVNVTVALRMRQKLERIFREEEFDIIQTHCPLVPTLPLTALRAARSDQKIVGTFHAAAEGNSLYRIFRDVLAPRAQRLDARIAVSEPARTFASLYFPGRYEIVPNGIDCDRFSPSVSPIEKPDEGSIRILYVGRMDQRKGVPYLLKAIPLAQKRLDRRIELVLIGEGRMRSIFFPKPLRLHGAEIRSVGRVDPELLPRYYRSADIFCSPATGRESFGIVLLEAMASGVPVIASDIPGYRRIITHGVDGLLTLPKEPEALADAIVSLGSSRSYRNELGSRGRKKALQYDWPIIAKRLEEIFLRIIKGEPCQNQTVPVRQGMG